MILLIASNDIHHYIHYNSQPSGLIKTTISFVRIRYRAETKEEAIAGVEEQEQEQEVVAKSLPPKKKKDGKEAQEE